MTKRSVTIKRRLILKIDKSFINLSSIRTFFQKSEVSIEQETQFSSILIDQLGQFSPDSSFSATPLQVSSPWYGASMMDGLEVVELKQQFLKEVKKLEQIMDAILSHLNRAGQGCSLNLNSFDRFNINPPPESTAQLVRYEHIQRRIFTYEEEEKTNFLADGTVKTKDGESIDFSLEMNLERSFFRQDEYVYSEQGYYLIDPLVINLDTSIPRLSQAQFSFDLDMDGEREDLAMLKPGSGLLSLDRNNDGIINDGSELFGPSTGSGFSELAEYDDDNDFWIDEDDDIFDDLTLWESDEKGDMHLTKLKDAGIGAIYLKNEDTPFDIRDQDNHLQARIKKSGIALNEDYSISSIQEMDWTV